MTGGGKSHHICNFENVLRLLAIILPIIQLTEQGGIFGAPEALYKSTDHVVILNATSIKSTVYGTSNSWVVEFYSSWCGHCIHFAPVFKQFAAEVEGWNRVVKIGVIDCADESNIAACREYEIMGYPTMLFFPPNSQDSKKTKENKSELNRGEPFPRSDKVSQLKHDLMEIVTPHFPNVLGEPPNASLVSLSTVWKYVTTSSKSSISLTVMIFENENSYTGKELALLLSHIPEVRVLRFTKRNHLYESLGIKDKWPAAGYFTPDLQSGLIPIPPNTDIVSSLKSAVLKLVHSDSDPGVSPSKQADPAAQIAMIETGMKEAEQDGVSKQENNLEEPASSASDDTVSLEDLIHSVRNSLRNEVGLRKVIEGEKLKVLKQYVHVLGQLFPADRRELIVFFKKLDAWLEQQENEVLVNEYLDKLTELEVELHPWDIDVSSWANCKGTVPGRRGYTCSLWRLFHTLTVLSAQKSEEIPVLPIIYGYVREFFGCTECVKHFTKMVQDEGALMITTARAQALWLWRAHNKVNIRLKGSASEDPGFPKGLYPSETQCSACHSSEGTFDEEKVFEYLTTVYTNPARTMKNSNSQIYYSGNAKALRQVRDQHESQQRPSRFFSGTDYWIFFIVYLSVAALLIFGYIHFKLGSRRRLDPLALCRKFISSSRSIV